MADFDIAYKRTKISEGGYSNHRQDKGNWTRGDINKGILIGTNYGISAPVLMAYLGRTPTVSEMKNLSLDTVRLIYEKNYWKPIRGNEIVNQDIANDIYDAGVMSGPGTAIKMAKKTRNYPESTIMDDKFLKILNQVA